jgi:hypothetical protein
MKSITFANSLTKGQEDKLAEAVEGRAVLTRRAKVDQNGNIQDVYMLTLLHPNTEMTPDLAFQFGVIVGAVQTLKL